jgi:6-phosphogluconolactonase
MELRTQRKREPGARPGWISGALLAALLAGCGGGGGNGGSGGNTPPPPPPPPPTFSVGGTITGLSGAGLVLLNNGAGNLAVPASGAFTFATRLPSGTAFTVTVGTQPANPSQTCAVTNGSGSVGSVDITSVAVACTTNSYSVGGSVSGLAGSGLSLSLNGGTEVPIAGNGNFVFPQTVASGATYDVRIAGLSHAPAQSCVLTGASGMVTSADVTTITVDCSTRYGQYALIADQVASTLSSFAVDSASGRMRLRDYKFTENGAVGVTVDSTGTHVYVASQGTDEITAYTLDKATGVLDQILGSPFATGDAPQKVHIDPSGQFLIVPNFLSGNLSVFARTATGALTPVAGSPFALDAAARPADIAFDPTGRFVFATDSAAQGVWAFTFNATTGALLPVVGSPFLDGADNPVDLEITHDGRLLFVANSLSDDISVFSIDAATGALTPVDGSPFGAGEQTRALALDPSGRFLYAANGDSDDLYTYTINRSTGVLAEVAGGRVATGVEPSAVRVDPTGQWLLVTNLGSSTVSTFQVDTSSGVPALLRSHATRRSPSALAMVQGPESMRIETRHAYVANNVSNTVSELAFDDVTGALDLQALAVASGDGPIDITVHPRGEYAYVVNLLSDTIQAYSIRDDGGLDANGAAVAAPGSPVKLLIEASGRFAYGADIDAGTITIYDIDAANGRLTARTAPVVVGMHLQTLAIDPAGQHLYAGTQQTPQIAVFRIDGTGGSLTPVGTPLPMAVGVFDLAVNAGGTRLYATLRQTDSMAAFVINRSTGALTAAGTAVPVGDSPRAAESHPLNGDLYTANYESDSISRLTALPAGGLAHFADQPVQDGPIDLAIEGGGRFMLVANVLQGSVTAHDLANGAPAQVDLVSVGDTPIAIALRETATLISDSP